MEEIPATLWIAACAHRLQQQWRTVDPVQLEEVAGDLWQNTELRTLPPAEAAVRWLEPVVLSEPCSPPINVAGLKS